MKKNNIATLGYFKNVLIPVVFYSGVSGVLVGIIVSFYNWLANLLTYESLNIYSFVRENLYFIPLLFLGLIAIALLVNLLLKITPEAKGGGVPRSEGVLRGLLTFRWLRILLTTIISSMLTYFSGMSLGTEGPSIQIGATTANGIANTLRCRHAWKAYVLSGGAGAGLAVAFNAPLTGIIFVLEEVHKRISPMIVLTAGSAVLFATLTSNAISQLWGGAGYIFEMGIFVQLPVSQIWALLLLGAIVGVGSMLFNWLILYSSAFIKKYIKIPQWLKLVLAFVVTGILGLVCLDSLGGGHSLIMKIGAMDFTLQVLLLLLVIKLFLIALSVNSGATGGLFVPMLAVGAIIGGIVGKLFILMGMDEIYYKTIVVIAMSATFGASVRAPISALVLIVEVTGHLSGFLMTGVAIFTAYCIVELFRIPPLYDAMLKPILIDANKDKTLEVVTYTIKVTARSFAEHKNIRDIMWPPNCLVINLRRGDSVIVPDGETELLACDILDIQTETFDSYQTLEYLTKIVRE